MCVIFVIRSINIGISFWVIRREFDMFFFSSIGLILSELIPSYVLFALLIPAKKEDKSHMVGDEVADYGSTPSHSHCVIPART